jgi:thymidylate synthase
MVSLQSTHPTAQQAWEHTLADLVRDGRPFGAARPGVEILGYTVGVDNVRARTGGHPKRQLGIVAAVARFVWMMAGSDRLEDIAFYEPKVRSFTDDHVIVPGSNYGARLRAAAPGLDQIAEAISRLTPDPLMPDNHLRRAANVIWRAEDAARASSDIPCAFGLGYFPRDGRLHTELVMRSNNAMLLMPFNLFEFSLLSEVVAVSARLQPGPLTVHAMSMHLYDAAHERGVAERVLAEPGAGLPQPMPPMPADDPLAQINLLVRSEAELRHAQASVAHDPLNVLRARAERLHPFWQAFFDVLLVHHLLTASRASSARELAAELPDWARSGAEGHIERHAAAEDGRSDARSRLFDPGEVDTGDLSNARGKIRSALRDDTEPNARAHIFALLDELEAEFELSFSDGHRVADALLRDESPIAARSSGTSGSATDFLQLSKEDVRAAIRKLGLDR